MGIFTLTGCAFHLQRRCGMDRQHCGWRGGDNHGTGGDTGQGLAKQSHEGRFFLRQTQSQPKSWLFYFFNHDGGEPPTCEENHATARVCGFYGDDRNRVVLCFHP